MSAAHEEEHRSLEQPRPLENPHPPAVNDTWVISSLRPVILSWGARRSREHSCPHCHLPLLTGEKPGFCCGPRGSHLNAAPTLPPLPAEFNEFIHHPRASELSRNLNLVFSFASMETTADFPDYGGDSGFIAIQGKVYHRVRPSHANSSVRWILYDGFMNSLAPHETLANQIPPAWIRAIQQALIRVNPFVLYLRVLSQIPPALCPDAQIIIEDTGTSPEIAAFMSYENTAMVEVRARRLIIRRTDEGSHAIPTISRLWEPLAYPLFFPFGTLGWGVVGSTSQLCPRHAYDNPLPDRSATQMWYYRVLLLHDERFEIFGRLTNEYLVDMFTRDLDCRLNYIRENQHNVMREDAELMGVASVEPTENIYLPSSFLGSNRWASEQIADSLALAAQYGPPTFFITMTCNPTWPEIVSQLCPGQTHTHVPLIVVRVFKQKLRRLEQLLSSMFPNAGHIVYFIHSIEFQKRGLPHAHILVKYSSDCVSPSAIDAVVSAELPTDPTDRLLVEQHMMHKHPPADSRVLARYCQRETDGVRTCRFHYPHPVRSETTVDHGGRVLYRRRHEEDGMVVPHCLPLLRALHCHINFEVANSSHLFQYIFKYIHKGPDRARYTVRAPGQAVDEIEEYWNARYLSAGEAAWRILGFHITRKYPAVTALPVHIPNTTLHRQYTRSNDSNEDSLSLLERYFARPHGTFTTTQGHLLAFDELTYCEYFTLFRLVSYNASYAHRANYFEEQHPPATRHAIRMHVVLRSASTDHIARVRPVRPSEGERFYIRTLLLHRAVRSFNDLLTIDNIQHSTFQLAASALGLFAHANEGDLAMQEAIDMLSTPHQLRVLFAHLLINDCISTPVTLWQGIVHFLAQDYIIAHNAHEALGVNQALQQLSLLLEEHGKTLSDYGLPEPLTYAAEVEHELERWYPALPHITSRAQNSISVLNADQQTIFDAVISAALNDTPFLAFVDGKAGTGKTFLVNAMCDFLRAREHVVLATATSAYAAQLYSGGRTTHSTFKVPVNNNNEFLRSPITARSSRGELIRHARLIIWDEAPMTNKAVLACVEATLRDVCNRPNVPFGGKTVVLLGDFRQTAPVVRAGRKADVLRASIKSSPLWHLFTIYPLTLPVRNAQDPEFATFIDNIGDGTAGPQVSLHLMNKASSAQQLIDFVFPPPRLRDPVSCAKRAILAPTNRQVDAYNEEIQQAVLGDSRTYLAADSLKEADDANIVPPADAHSLLDYAARRTPPGLPPHTLVIKINAVYRLLRNFSIEQGLVKNVRVVVTALGNRVITVRILRHDTSQSTEYGNGESHGQFLIPRITFTHELHSGFTLLRRQYPLALAYATTFHSCQGLTLDRVGVDLTTPVFTHGQLYTALSRVRHRSHALVRLPEKNLGLTTNVTYNELLL